MAGKIHVAFCLGLEGENGEVQKRQRRQREEITVGASSRQSHRSRDTMSRPDFSSSYWYQ